MLNLDLLKKMIYIYIIFIHMNRTMDKQTNKHTHMFTYIHVYIYTFADAYLEINLSQDHGPTKKHISKTSNFMAQGGGFLGILRS